MNHSFFIFHKKVMVLTNSYDIILIVTGGENYDKSRTTYFQTDLINH